MAVGEAAAAKLADVAEVVIMIMGAEAATVATVGATLVRSRWRAEDRADEGGRPSVAGESPEQGGGGEGKTRGMAPEGWGR